MLFRIGVNLGDIVDEGDRIYGDGVNIAARLEGLAEAGGICISHTAFDQAKGKLEVGYQYLGEHSVKNIAEPVRAYKILLEPEAVGKVFGEKRKTRMWMIVAAAVVILVGLAGWYLYIEQSKRIEPASVEKMAFPLPEKPSIAVLAFDNLSGDPDHEFIADGISENIITVLSYIPELFVIARNSSFTYKGRPVKVQQVSEELGVKYVLEGSVLLSEKKLRITAQLIDALTGGHIWSERYDRDFGDLLNLIDEITLAIAVALQVELTTGEQARAISTDNLDAWRYFNKGGGIFLKFTKEAFVKSRELFKKALEIDPNYAAALTSLAWTHFMDARFGYTDSREESFKRAVELANQSEALDDKQPMVHSLLQFIYLIQKQYDKAIEEGRKAVALDPNNAQSYAIHGETLFCSGFFEESVPICEKAIRLHPYAPLYYFSSLSNAYYWVGRYEESLAVAEQLINRSKKAGFRTGERWGFWFSARAKVKLGRESEAKEDFAKFLELAPGWTWKSDLRNTLYKPEIKAQEHQDMLVLRLPGHPSSQ
jgi:adenylate cyclase